ncbi:hypothetical protein ScPMuIL_000647 [Solemya velum]
MTTNLEDLFEQIIHSERRAQERRNLLHEIRTQANDFESELCDLENEALSLRGEVVLKVQHLNEEEMRVKWLTSKQKIVEDQRRELMRRRTDLKQQLSQLKCEREGECATFCEEVRKFSENYSLTGNGRCRRESQASQAMLEKRQEEKNLLKSLESFTAHRCTIGALTEARETLRAELATFSQKETDLQHDLDFELEKVKKLEDEKNKLLVVPQKDPEFQRLQKDLEETKSESLERRCCELQLELQSLQKRVWQKQVTVQDQHQKGMHDQQWRVSRSEDTVRSEVETRENPPKTEKGTNCLHLSNFGSGNLQTAKKKHQSGYDTQVAHAEDANIRSPLTEYFQEDSDFDSSQSWSEVPETIGHVPPNSAGNL